MQNCQNGGRRRRSSGVETKLSHPKNLPLYLPYLPTTKQEEGKNFGRVRILLNQRYCLGMMSSIKFLWMLVVCMTVSYTLSEAESQKLSAYEVLLEYGFPVGLLPKGALGYSLNRETGEFAVYFDKTCSFEVEGYTLSYKPTITGVISPGRLYQLKGVSVKVFILWLSIGEVILKDGHVQFSVGIASADFTVDNFYESPQCGCGFDCNHLRLYGDVSSS
ncbi:hypothetical protein VNO77_13990 [Canavalia gladiata]|uniref:DUF538 family protein n=1 Tax=Canavalia gladiata TaxID=3824 RepID=A0AAN9QNJ4_CANGL